MFTQFTQSKRTTMKIKIACSLFYFLLLSLAVYAQDSDYAPLARDKTIVKGVVLNGMTYYIKSTDVVKDAGSYYIIQNRSQKIQYRSPFFQVVIKSELQGGDIIKHY